MAYKPWILGLLPFEKYPPQLRHSHHLFKIIHCIIESSLVQPLDESLRLARTMIFMSRFYYACALWLDNNVKLNGMYFITPSLFQYWCH